MNGSTARTLLRALALAACAAAALAGCGRSANQIAEDSASTVRAPATPGDVGTTTTASPEPGEPAPVRRSQPPPRAGESPDSLAAKGAVPGAPPAIPLLLPGACCSESRHGRRVDTIIVHTTETPDRKGPNDLVALWELFSKVRRSSHVADDAEGNSIRLVNDSRVAYHATYWNISSVGIEQVGYAAFSRKQWLARPKQLEATARWIAHWARLYRIPIQPCRLSTLGYNRNTRVVQGRILKRGVCSHGQVDPRNRTDPGAGYPWDVVMARARQIAAGAG